MSSFIKGLFLSAGHLEKACFHTCLVISALRYRNEEWKVQRWRYGTCSAERVVLHLASLNVTIRWRWRCVFGSLSLSYSTAHDWSLGVWIMVAAAQSRWCSSSACPHAPRVWVPISSFNLRGRVRVRESHNCLFNVTWASVVDAALHLLLNLKFPLGKTVLYQVYQ